jgi:hypothetical protein
MTMNEFKRQTQTLADQAQAAKVCGNPERSIELSMERARLMLAHPEFWPGDPEPDQIRYNCEGTIWIGQLALRISGDAKRLRTIAR